MDLIRTAPNALKMQEIHGIHQIFAKSCAGQRQGVQQALLQQLAAEVALRGEQREEADEGAEQREQHLQGRRAGPRLSKRTKI